MVKAELLRFTKPYSKGGYENFQFCSEDAEPVGFLVPKGTDLEPDEVNKCDFGSLGITGSEIEKFRSVAEQLGKSEIYKKVKYLESDMSAKGETNKVCKLGADELKDKKIDVKSDLSPLKAWEEFTYPDYIKKDVATFYNKIYLVLELPDGLSYTRPDGEYEELSEMEEFVKVNNSKYRAKIVTVEGKKVTMELIYKENHNNLEDFKKNANLDIDLSVGAIKYDSIKRLDKKYTIRGSIYGFLSNYDHDPQLRMKRSNKNSINNFYKTAVQFTNTINVFSTTQEPAGKDDSSKLDKIMSITVAAKSHTVTFINGSNQSTVLVEPGKSINGDIDNSQSMPSDPTRPGYTFKGWFTQPDGKGDKFTGDTVVNSDMTVYAYFKKDPFKPYNPGEDPGKVDGDDRIETGIEISKKFYGKAKTVIVVRHDLFPDSMTSSVLAKLKDAPILLNPTDRLDPRGGTEIKRLGAEEVIIVGGPDSISERVREALKAYDKDNNVERVAGSDRYGTSEMVAKRVAGITGKKNVGVVASGQVFPDALSAGTFASRDGYPILLVKKESMPDQIVRAINDLNIKNTYIAGGINTVSKSVEAKLPGVLERMAGKNRYETSVAIAKSKFKDSKKAFVASGEEFADALVISPVSGMYNRPTLLASRNKNNNTVVKKYIHEAGLISITGIGGEKYLPYSILLDLVGK